MYRCNVADAHVPIALGAPFEASNMSGEEAPIRAYTGYLPPYWRQRFQDDMPVYAVYSYGTPIAWVTRHGVKVYPPVTYSKTTARHQTQVKRAWDWHYLRLNEPVSA